MTISDKILEAGKQTPVIIYVQTGGFEITEIMARDLFQELLDARARIAELEAKNAKMREWIHAERWHKVPN